MDLLAYGSALLAWAAVIYKVPALRQPCRPPALQAYWTALLSTSIGLTLAIPSVALGFDQLTSIPNLARLCAHMTGLVNASCAQVYMNHLELPPGRSCAANRPAIPLLILAIAAAAALFALAGARQEVIDFSEFYADVPWIVAYRLLIVGYVSWVLRSIIVIASRYARLSRHEPLLHSGMRLVAIGGWVGAGYQVHETLRALAAGFHVGYPVPAPEALKQLLLVVSLSLILIGTTLPSWGARVGIPQLSRWFARYRACRDLYPLWRDLCQASPEIALAPPASALIDALAVRHLGFRLSRRVVEIRDGRLALRPYLSRAAVTAAERLGEPTSLSEHERQALVEAACLTAALHAKRRGWVAHPPGRMPTTPGGVDVNEEVTFLTRVAHHYAHLNRQSRMAPCFLDTVAEAERSPTDADVPHALGRN